MPCVIAKIWSTSKAWIYQVLAGLETKLEKISWCNGWVQVNASINTKGQAAETICDNLTFEKEEQRGFNLVVLANFNAHFILKVNVIHERA